VREVINRCLQKDLKKRYSRIADAVYEIEQALADPGGLLLKPVAAAKSRAGLRMMLRWLAAAAVMAAGVMGIAVWNLKPPAARHTTATSRHSKDKLMRCNSRNCR
jgi:hypothetical protein